jgi:hypothetical protein
VAWVNSSRKRTGRDFKGRDEALRLLAIIGHQSAQLQARKIALRSFSSSAFRVDCWFDQKSILVNRQKLLQSLNILALRH